MSSRIVAVSAIVFVCLAPAVGQKKKVTPVAASAPSYEAAQPTQEKLDLGMYSAIRQEGIGNSHIMEYSSALFDGIGPRLTGSPNMKRANEWTRDQLAAMGCVNAHLEDWGEFGMGWQQRNTWVRMASPDTAVFIGQAAPWSPATDGAVTAPVVYVQIGDEKDIEPYRGKLGGKIVLLSMGKGPRDVKLQDKALSSRYTEEELRKRTEYPTEREPSITDQIGPFIKQLQLQEKVGKFLVEEKAVAVLRPSRDGQDNGGSGGTIFDDSSMDMSWFAYQREHANPLPIVVLAIENYGRMYRLLKAHVPVTVEMNVDTKFTGDHEHGFDTIAEIPGTDPQLKDEVVMVGGHLDSWASGTGATDNGAGSVVAMEVMRILNALKVKPRRTIRIGLWSGEEQGLFGSVGYVGQHFGSFPKSTAPDQIGLPEFVRKPAGPLQLKPEQAKLSAYFNIDNGGGRVRGIYLEHNAAVEPIFRQWIAPLADLGVTTITMRHTGGTDHESFDAVGIPGFQFIQDPLEYGSRTHHSNMDVYERLQPEDLAQAATVEAIFVYNAAMRDQMLPRKPLPHPELDEERAAPLRAVMPGAEMEEKPPLKDVTKTEQKQEQPK